MKPHWEQLQFGYPFYTLRLRRDVIEWIEQHGGKKFLRKLIYKLYGRVVAKQFIDAKRKAHKRQFKELKKGKSNGGIVESQTIQ